MRALRFSDHLFLDRAYPKPKPGQNEALIRVIMTGICNTDIEITKGYFGFQGVLGHEFVGVVEAVNGGAQHWVGRRVVGEINCGCGSCAYCRRNLQRHCPNRTVLGIAGKDGCLADYITLPVENLHAVPDVITNGSATFVEPLAAAFEILEQVHIIPSQEICILGDGKLGLLVNKALRQTMAQIIHIGKHESKLQMAQGPGIKTELWGTFEPRLFDIVIEATGSVSGFQAAPKLVKPRGTLVLKSTIAESPDFDFTTVVVNELTVIGSRCGLFGPALRALEKGLDVSSLVTEVLPFDQAEQAIDLAQSSENIKVLLDMRKR